MATFQEFAEQYAARVCAALLTDGFTRTASVEASTVQYSQTAAVLKNIAAEIDSATVDDRPISNLDKDRLLTLIGQELTLEEPGDFIFTIKAASNDAYMELVTHINGLKKNR